MSVAAGWIFAVSASWFLPTISKADVLGVTPLGLSTTNQYEVAIDFSEALDPASASVASTYTISTPKGGLPIANAKYSESSDSFRVTVSLPAGIPVPPGTYDVRIDGSALKNKSGQPFLPRVHDIAVHLADSDRLVRIRHDGHGGWSKDELAELGKGCPSIVLAEDFDKDGIADLIVGSLGYHQEPSSVGEDITRVKTLFFYKGLGGKKFALPRFISLTNAAVVIKAVDWNKDSILDLVAKGEDTDRKTTYEVLLGDGTGKFKTIPDTPFLGGSDAFEVGDIVGDGGKEIVSIGYEDYLDA